MDPLQASITRLPTELSNIILVELSNYPLAISSLAQTCRLFHTFIYHSPDNHLWRELFLQVFDDPHSSNPLNPNHEEDFDWGDAYRERMWACKHFRRGYPMGILPRVSAKRAKRWSCENAETNIRAMETLISLIHMAEPFALTPPAFAQSTYDLTHTTSFVYAHHNTPILPQFPSIEKPSRNIDTFDSAFENLYPLPLANRLVADHIDSEWDVTPEAQIFYKLVTYTGRFGSRDIPAGKQLNSKKGSSATERRSALAKRRVYNIDYPHEDRMFGPFIPCSKPTNGYTRGAQYQFVPDWAQLAAIRTVVQMSLDLYPEYKDLLPGFGILHDRNALRCGAWNPRPAGQSEEDGDESDTQDWDWAGVEGVWRRAVTWLDYDGLILHNESDFTFPTPIEESETRCIAPVRLRVTSYSHDRRAPSKFPRINFEGEIGGEGWKDDVMTDAEASIRYIKGHVSMLVDGSVRWSQTSYFDKTYDEMEWTCEGVQLGGIGSLAGILGIWTTGELRGDAEPIGGWWQWRVA